MRRVIRRRIRAPATYSPVLITIASEEAREASISTIRLNKRRDREVYVENIYTRGGRDESPVVRTCPEFHLLRAAESRIARTQEYGTRSFGSRREIFCARGSGKQRSEAEERRRRRLGERNGGEEKERKREKEGGETGGEKREREKNGSTVEASAREAFSESRSDGVVVPRLLNLFEIPRILVDKTTPQPAAHQAKSIRHHLVRVARAHTYIRWSISQRRRDRRFQNKPPLLRLPALLPPLWNLVVVYRGR